LRLKLAVKGPGGLVLGDQILSVGALDKGTEVELNGQTIRVFAEPMEEQIKVEVPPLIGVLVKCLIELAWAVEDLAAGQLECWDYEKQILSALRPAVKAPGVDHIVPVFLNQVKTVFRVQSAFAAIRTLSLDGFRIWCVCDGEQMHKTISLADAFELESMIKVKHDNAGQRSSMAQIRLWSPKDHQRSVFGKIFDVSDSETILTSLLTISEQSPFGVVGVGKSDLMGESSEVYQNSVVQQWLAIYIGLMAGAIAAAAWTEAEAEREREAARTEAFRSIAARGAHRIKNPLFFLQGELNLISDDIKDELGEVPRPIMDRIDRAKHFLLRIEEITNGFQAFSQEDAVRLDKYDVCAIVSAAIESAFHGKLEFNLPGITCAFPSLYVPLDKEMFTSILEELFGNAQIFMPHGGTFEVAITGPHPQGTLPMDDWMYEYYMITMSDTGPGIKQSDKKRIFEPFYTSRANGTGLGLAIARKYCETMGWRIIEDGPGSSGVGARFRIAIPIVEKDRNE
jgi:signal transduction histidine kinase